MDWTGSTAYIAWGHGGMGHRHAVPVTFFKFLKFLYLWAWIAAARGVGVVVADVNFKRTLPTLPFSPGPPLPPASPLNE